MVGDSALDFLRRDLAGKPATLDADVKGAASHVLDKWCDRLLDLLGERLRREGEGALDRDYSRDEMCPALAAVTRRANALEKSGYVLHLSDADIFERGWGELPEPTQLRQCVSHMPRSRNDGDDQIPLSHGARVGR